MPAERWRPRPRSRAVAVTVIAVLVLLSLAAAPARAAAPRESLRGHEFVERIASDGVDAERLIITGDVDLRGLGRVDELIACRDCTVEGSVLAADVVFERVVDLSGVQIHGALDLHGATFHDAFLFERSADRAPLVAGATNLQMVTFAHQSGFDGIEFAGPFDARSMTARGNASLVEVRFIEVADFARTQFQSTANLSGATFFEAARFDRAQFAGPMLAQEARFQAPVVFRRVRFDAGADLTYATFRESASFDRAIFASATSFRFVQGVQPLSLDQVQVLDSLDFHTANLPGGISLEGVATTGLVSLTGAFIGEDVASGGATNPAQVIRLEPPPTAGLMMDVSDTERIAGPMTQIKALAVLEETAAGGGDLPLANDARYRLLALSGARQPPGRRVLDAVFYRSMAGYLVRPLHPLLWLVVAIAVASAVRATAYRRAERGRSRSRRRPGGDRWSFRAVARALPAAAEIAAAAVGASLRRAVTRQGHDDGAARSRAAGWALGAEVFAYRALIAVALITIGNSSATVREVIDAIHG